MSTPIVTRPEETLRTRDLTVSGTFFYILFALIRGSRIAQLAAIEYQISLGCGKKRGPRIRR